MEGGLVFQEEVNEQYAINMASENLNLASIHADKKRDVESLVTIAAAWMEFSRILGGSPGQIRQNIGRVRTGFFPPEEEIVEDEDDEE